DSRSGGHVTHRTFRPLVRLWAESAADIRQAIRRLLSLDSHSARPMHATQATQALGCVGKPYNGCGRPEQAPEFTSGNMANSLRFIAYWRLPQGPWRVTDEPRNPSARPCAAPRPCVESREALEQWRGFHAARRCVRKPPPVSQIARRQSAVRMR